MMSGECMFSDGESVYGMYDMCSEDIRNVNVNIYVEKNKGNSTVNKTKSPLKLEVIRNMK